MMQVNAANIFQIPRSNRDIVLIVGDNNNNHTLSSATSAGS